VGGRCEAIGANEGRSQQGKRAKPSLDLTPKKDLTGKQSDFRLADSECQNVKAARHRDLRTT